MPVRTSLLRLSNDELEPSGDVLGRNKQFIATSLEHKNKLIKGFTEKYNVNKLVYFEETADVRRALEREKEIKKWRRQKKNALVQSVNPEWNDLSEVGKDFSLRSK